MPTLNLPKLYPAQHEAIFNDARYSICEASTKSGKTVGCLVWILHKSSTLQPWQHCWWVAPVYAQAQDAFRRMRDMLRQSGVPCEVNVSERWICLSGAGKIWFRSAEKTDNLYGANVYAAVVDEATRCREEAWFALRSTITATQAQVRFIGNVKGRKNWVYRMARKAESGEPDFHYAKITAWDAVDGGVLDRGEIEAAERELPEAVFRQLYLAEPMGDEGNPFGVEAIRRCVSGGEESREKGHWGVDLAKKVDWTVAIRMARDGLLCGLQRWRTDWKNTEIRIRHMIGRESALIDSTGVGDPIVEEMQRDCRGVVGQILTPGPTGSKQKLMEGLTVAIQRGLITIPATARYEVLVRELESFEYVVRVDREGRERGVTYEAASGMHDDCVIALALALECGRIGPRAARVSLIGVGTDAKDPYESGYDPLTDEDLWDDVDEV